MEVAPAEPPDRTMSVTESLRPRLVVRYEVMATRLARPRKYRLEGAVAPSWACTAAGTGTGSVALAARGTKERSVWGVCSCCQRVGIHTQRLQVAHKSTKRVPKVYTRTHACERMPVSTGTRASTRASPMRLLQTSSGEYFNMSSRPNVVVERTGEAGPVAVVDKHQ